MSSSHINNQSLVTGGLTRVEYLEPPHKATIGDENRNLRFKQLPRQELKLPCGHAMAMVWSMTPWVDGRSSFWVNRHQRSPKHSSGSSCSWICPVTRRSNPLERSLEYQGSWRPRYAWQRHNCLDAFSYIMNDKSTVVHVLPTMLLSNHCHTQ